MIDDATIVEAGRRLSAAAPGARVVLFGSHARGQAGPRSETALRWAEQTIAWARTAIDAVH